MHICVYSVWNAQNHIHNSYCHHDMSTLVFIVAHEFPPFAHIQLKKPCVSRVVSGVLVLMDSVPASLDLWEKTAQVTYSILEISIIDIYVCTHDMHTYTERCSVQVPNCANCQVTSDGEIVCTACDAGYNVEDNECKSEYIGM